MATDTSTSAAGSTRVPSSSGNSHSTSHSSSGSSRSASSESRHYWTQDTYDNRYQRAIAAGMSPEKARQYASASYASVEDSPLEFGIFRKTSSDKKREENEAADAKLWNDLLDQERTMDENSPSAENQRLAAAGINTALTGGDQLGTGDGEGVDDLASDQVASTRAINEESAALPGQIASTLANALGGVMNVINSGVNIYDTFFDMDVKEGKATFDTINSMSDLGNFFPFLNIGYNPEEDTWYDLDDPENVKLDNNYVLGLPYEDFMNRISKRTGIRTKAFGKALFNAYRSMVSPKSINSYMDSRKKNIDLQNETIDSMAAGVPRTGALTTPVVGFKNVPGLANGSKFESSYSKATFDKYVGYMTDLQLLGFEAQLALTKANTKQSENLLTTEIINERCLTTLNNLTISLRNDAMKGDPLARYLLVNMLSNSFPNGAYAAQIYGKNSEVVEQPKPVSAGIKQFFDDPLGTMRSYFDRKESESMLNFLWTKDTMKDILPSFRFVPKK